MKFAPLALILAASLTSACATRPAPSAEPPAATSALIAISAEVSERKLQVYIEKMVSFGTRHTLSDTVSDSRGVGAARRWVGSEFKAISADCGGCLEIVTPSEVITSPPRVPVATEIMNVVAVQRGTGDPNRVIIIQGHLDSRVTDAMNAISDSPGANDDASGVAAVIETARILSKHKFSATLVYAALTGEEQGLHGGRILANYANAEGWKVEAVLNNDIVGNTLGSGGVVLNDRVRVFSEGVRSAESKAQTAARKSVGGEVDSPSRNLARYVDQIAARHLGGFDVMMVYRRDRFGRGGDQVPMVEAGFPAVRITEASENYTRQHQDLRIADGVVYGDTIDGVDFPYLARVTRLNALTMASLASAPPPPLEVRVEGAVGPDSTVSWTATSGADSYVVWWRGTTDPVWTDSRAVAGTETSMLLPGIVIDDWFFGVSTLSKNGYASPVQFAGIVGAFFPPPPAAPN
jgi:Peptidase family M28